MAKSLRSKWKRKMRAVKRERYGQKELARLKNILGINDGSSDANMENISDIVTVADPKSLQAEHPSTSTYSKPPEEEMDHDKKRVYNKKTLRDQYGNYPVWMSSRKIKAIASKNKITKKQKKKAAKKRKKTN
ncbi:protein LLP homolog isoform X2 [Schistocerca cancellata]|nr:protein LLP homolog isoform X2 [Schistocerca cancellata]XP_049776742.1 protein LLP homolog isoform X2 [Schistocerca cancellata]XP_049776743.1 protein LLP homolog isoform X2 [Schistocerca cancellata]